MVAGPYNLPQGIEVGGLGPDNTQAVPRKVGAYDTEAHNNGVAIVSPLQFFQNSTAFTAAGLALNKSYGRDTNLTSRVGGMSKGERLYGYGITAKVLFGNTAAADLLNAVANQVSFAEFLQYWMLCDVAINLGADEFIRCQARDVPLWAPLPTATTFPTTTLFDLHSDGMFDMTISGDPYVFDQQEDFRLLLSAAALPANNPTQEWYITFKIEGIRLKALRQ